MIEPKYWLVGATWSGEDQVEEFFSRGSWEIGYSDVDKPKFATLRDSMRPGDRIAVKKGHGPGTSSITIRGIGEVKQVANGIVYVKWVLFNLNREVDSKGCYATIHGPYKRNDKEGWINEVFCL